MQEGIKIYFVFEDTICKHIFFQKNNHKAFYTTSRSGNMETAQKQICQSKNLQRKLLKPKINQTTKNNSVRVIVVVAMPTIQTQELRQF